MSMSVSPKDIGRLQVWDVSGLIRRPQIPKAVGDDQELRPEVRSLY